MSLAATPQLGPLPHRNPPARPVPQALPAGGSASPSPTAGRPPGVVRARVYLVLALGVAAALLLVLKLVELQIVQHEVLSGFAVRQLEDSLEIPGPRGDIVDRNENLLATSVPVSILAVEARELDTLGLRAIETAAGTPNRLIGRAKRPWVIVRNDCGDRERRAVEALIARGVVPKDSVHWLPSYRREYPNHVRLAHLLGFVNHEGVGGEGVERMFSLMLRSASSHVELTRDALGRPLDQLGSEPSGPPPQNLMLTIDLRIQSVLEDALLAAVEEHKAISAQGVVLDPRSGDVLAMASMPSYDPNQYGRYELHLHRNTTIEQPFEPGSVVKPFIAAALLESGAISGDEQVYCELGRWQLGKSRSIGDVARHATLTVGQVIERSSNIGIVKLSRRVESRSLSRVLRRFGFGSRTGIDLPLEHGGILPAGENWKEHEKDSVAFGHALMVTPLQLAQATGVIANGGLRVSPRVARATGAPGAWNRRPERSPQRALSPATAARAAQWMQLVVDGERGTGHRAAIPGFSVAGKSGTAEKLLNGHYSKSQNMASFLGFAPVNEQAIVVAITVDAPQGIARTGGVVAAPVFKTVLSEALRLRRVPPDRPDDPKLLEAKGVAEDSAPETLESAPTAQMDVADVHPAPPRPASARRTQR